MKTEIVLRIVCIAALVSTLLWAFFGISFWSDVSESKGRGGVLFMLHLVAIFAWPIYKIEQQ